jgi:hypothetical protein
MTCRYPRADKFLNANCSQVNLAIHCREYFAYALTPGLLSKKGLGTCTIESVDTTTTLVVVVSRFSLVKVRKPSSFPESNLRKEEHPPAP